MKRKKLQLYGVRLEPIAVKQLKQLAEDKGMFWSEYARSVLERHVSRKFKDARPKN